jgi:acetyltransferase-like isoleucine patch superfamily enzyme
MKNFFKRIGWKLQAMKSIRNNRKNLLQVYKAVATKPRCLEARGKITVRQNTRLFLGENIILFPNIVFWGGGEIILGNEVQIGDNTMIFSSMKSGVSIGDKTLIAANCYIIDCDHQIDKNSEIICQGIISSPVNIGKGCWIGANVTILRGAIIHDGAVIGAGAVVKGEIPANAIAVGVPAKVVKYRE